jgi:diguanylate cyclase (GGDEF)-like protein/PAS domain S-box-containing protein
VSESAADSNWSDERLTPDLVRTMLEMLPDGVVLHAPSGEVIAANAAAGEILGLTIDQLRGLTSLDPRWKSIHEDGSPYPGEDHPAMVTLATGAPVDNSIMGVVRGSDEQRWIKISSRPVHIDGEMYVAVTFGDITSMRSVEGLVAHFAHHDLLTDLPNRIRFEQLLEGAIGRSDRTGGRCAVVVASLDHFGTTNEHVGTQGADTVLIESAFRLQRLARDGDAVGRVGDDQFALLLENCGTEEQIRAIAEEVRVALAEPIAVGSTEHIPSLTLGIAVHASGDDEDLLVSAIGALETAKRRERGSIRFYGGIDRRSVTTYRHDQGIRRAIARGDVRLWYQPIRDLDENRTIGAEALFRIENADEQGAGQAILTPEILGTLGPRIAVHVLDLLVEDARAMKSAGTLPESLSVNLTAPDLLVPRIHTQVQESGEALRELGAVLTVEVSEQVGLQDLTGVRPAIEELRSTGIRIALDDFGTGSNSLALLRELPLDSIKLDGSFIQRAMTNAAYRAIIKASVTLAEELGLPVVAEGVETESLLAFVRSAGIRYAQGYVFERPRPPGTNGT